MRRVLSSHLPKPRKSEQKGFRAILTFAFLRSSTVKGARETHLRPTTRRGERNWPKGKDKKFSTNSIKDVLIRKRYLLFSSGFFAISGLRWGALFMCSGTVKTLENLRPRVSLAWHARQTRSVSKQDRLWVPPHLPRLFVES
ncbi:hypothetical protein PoB_007558000 [Plakobranchus ocellatus]|uniref:Transmembrane protein n=1 Tax=Plakobranchus ocellatus TaxID=259542 RepID=A0AAV4DY06_9GAST|nr:hypothetical protein PoB_007558000 [Plakobranchus ocellatus]